jgi:hypothetical protein
VVPAGGLDPGHASGRRCVGGLWGDRKVMHIRLAEMTRLTLADVDCRGGSLRVNRGNA